MNSKKAKGLRKDAKDFSSKIGTPNVWDKIYEHMKKSTKGITTKKLK